MNKAQRDIRRKKWVLEHAARIGNVRKTCRYFGVARSGFYVWKKAYETPGDEGLVTQKPCPYNPRLRTPPAIVEKVLHLRRTSHLGPIRIVWYLERYHAVQPSFGATDCSTAHSEAWASRCSSTIRTARSRTSGENRLGRDVPPLSVAVRFRVQG